MSDAAYSGALEAIDRIVNRAGDAEEVVRGAVEVIHARLGCYVQVLVADGHELAPGPDAGRRESGMPSAAFPIDFAGARVGSLVVGLDPDDAGRAFLERAATLISPYLRSG